MGGKIPSFSFLVSQVQVGELDLDFPQVEKRAETLCPGASAVDACGTSSRLCRLDLRI